MNAAAGQQVRTPVVLHAGCGGDPLPDWLGLCIETRLDIDPKHKPDILASITDLGDIGPFDVVYCCHALEHLTPMDGLKALEEFHRVLNPGGAVIITVPNLEGISPTFDVVYESPAGPITGHDMIYGHLAHLGNPYMQHRTGFIPATLTQRILEAGFTSVPECRSSNYNLVAVGVK